ncbi:MAG: hypothetical protein RJA81_85 [Planctomycetota bacterium]|jgi:glycosyltransferase involved in cell wall biosynthesis
MNQNRCSLYISYFGIRQPLVQTQVIPYLIELAKVGWSVHLMTFEPDWPENFSEVEIHQIQQSLRNKGIIWHPEKYTKSHSLFSKLKDIYYGVKAARKIIRTHQVSIIHGRAHVATAIGWLAGLFQKRKLLFDIRGLKAEEQVESGQWTKSGLNFQLLKFMERLLLSRASGFVVLTHAGRKALFPQAISNPDLPSDMFLLPDGRPVQIIPCCVDTTRCIPNGQAVVSNKTELKKKLGLENCSRLIVHLGALGGLYPEDRIVAVFEEIHRNDPDTGLLVISQAPTDTLIRLYKEAGLPESHLWTGRVGVTEVIGYLSLCDWGLSVKHESHSQLFCSPTKIPEYLLAGLPILASRGIGDTDEILKDHDIGIVFNALDRSSIRDAVQQMPSLKRDASLPDRCRKIATLVFNLQDIGGKRYQALYEVLLGDDQLRVGK